MLRRPITLTWLLLLLGGGGLPVYALQNQPEVEFKRIRIHTVSLSDKKAEATVTLEIKNPGAPLKLKDASYRLKLNDEYVADGKLEKEVALPAQAATTLDMPLTINLNALPGAAWGFLSNSLTLRYDVETEFVVSLFGLDSGKMRLNYNGEETMKSLLAALYEKIKEQLTDKQ